MSEPARCEFRARAKSLTLGVHVHSTFLLEVQPEETQNQQKRVGASEARQPSKSEIDRSWLTTCALTHLNSHMKKHKLEPPTALNGLAAAPRLVGQTRKNRTHC